MGFHTVSLMLCSFRVIIIIITRWQLLRAFNLLSDSIINWTQLFTSMVTFIKPKWIHVQLWCWIHHHNIHFKAYAQIYGCFYVFIQIFLIAWLLCKRDLPSRKLNWILIKYVHCKMIAAIIYHNLKSKIVSTLKSMFMLDLKY